MLALRLAALILLALPLGARAQEQPSGVYKDGLVLYLMPDKATSTPDENPAFTLHFVNATKGPLYFTHTSPPGWEMRFKSLEAGGKEYRVVNAPVPFGFKGFWPLIEIASDKAFDLKHEVRTHLPAGAAVLPGTDCWYVDTDPAKKNEKLRSLPPGKYTLTVALSLYVTATKATLANGIKGKALTLPLTKLTTNPVKIEIAAKK